MPVFPNRVPDLQLEGPIIEVFVFPSRHVTEQLGLERKSNRTKKVIALIDTGASGSCIHHEIASELNLIARDITIVQTPAGISEHPVYDVEFSLPNLNDVRLPTQVIGVDLENQPYHVLIGRDILKLCTIIYNGWDNSYQLHL